jgi:aryl-alcohol dehydrogenase-like predicted oxidoreductase
VVLASKTHMPMGEDPNQRGDSRRWIIREVENSLRRLGTEWPVPAIVAAQWTARDRGRAVHLRAADLLGPHPRYRS